MNIHLQTENVLNGPTSNNIQSVVDIDTMFETLSWLDKKFYSIFDSYFENHTGNFYITTQLHDCHVDYFLTKMN